MAITNPRTGPAVIAAFAWQAAEGAVAATADAVKIQVERFDVSPTPSAIDPQGTTGSIFNVDTHRLVALEPTASLELFGSLARMDFLLESVTGGQPTATQAAGDITEAGDDLTDYANWTLTGVRPGINTDATGKLYLTCLAGTPIAGTTRIQMFSDAAKTALVAQGDIPDTTAAGAIAEQNDSGLSATVDVAAVGAGDLDIVLTVVQRRFNFANAWSRFFTLWRDTGQELERLTDCVVQRLTFASEDKGPLMLSADIVSKQWEKVATALVVPGQAETDILAHQDLALRTDLAGGPVVQSPLSCSFLIENTLVAPLAGSDRPTKIIKQRADLSASFTSAASTESAGRVDAGIADAFHQADAVWTLGAKALTLTWARTKTTDFKLPEFAGGAVGDHESTHTARAQGAAGIPLTLVLAV